MHYNTDAINKVKVATDKTHSLLQPRVDLEGIAETQLLLLLDAVQSYNLLITQLPVLLIV